MILQRRLRFFAIWAAASLVCSLQEPALCAARYNIVALKELPDAVLQDTAGLGINNVGDIVGYSTLDRTGHIGQIRPVRWGRAGVPDEIWTDRNVGGVAWDINDVGQVVGQYGSGSGIPTPTTGVPFGRAFFWDVTNGRQDLGLAPLGNSIASAINESGQVVGTSEVFEPAHGGFIAHAFIWDAEQGIRAIGDLTGGDSFAHDINNQGQVVGYGNLPNGEWGAFVWDKLGGVRQLPTLTDGSAQAAAINDLGQIVGGEVGIGGVIWDLTSGNFHQIPISARDINNVGQVVGDSLEGPALWDAVNGIQLLRDIIPSNLEWKLAFAFRIDDDGNIVGYGRFEGEVRGFLLTPIPEPSTSTLICLFGLGLISRRAFHHTKKLRYLTCIF
jgi:probable HAF family extracellular repeat protein